MNIERPIYLQRLIDRRQNGMIKIITGLRRSGKSYLLFTLFCQYLKEQGIDDTQVIKLDLENIYNERYRSPLPLLDYISQRVTDTRGHRQDLFGLYAGRFPDGACCSLRYQGRKYIDTPAICQNEIIKS